MRKIKSEGKCHYCNKLYANNKISSHLGSHLKKAEKEKPSKKKSFHIKVTGAGSYFLHMLIHEDATIGQLDSYLRSIWLECCGHLSSFEVKGARKVVNNWLDPEEFGINMKTKAGKLFEKGLKLDYEYDFGSTTQLAISVMNEYFIEDKEKVLLLSRNEPLKFLCELCEEKAAEVMCSICYDGPTMFCDSCKGIHAKECGDFDDYAETDVVNSPRMGVCGYDGGRIDVARDGVWQNE